MTSWLEQYRQEQEKKEKAFQELVYNNTDKLIAWCDAQVAEGKSLQIRWDGGNDSGSFSMYLEDEEIAGWNHTDHEEANVLLELADRELEYGSFAGDYYTEGALEYNPATKCFEGDDNYSEDEWCDIEGHGIEIRVPKHLWFNRLEGSFQLEDSNMSNIALALVVQNGPRTEAHTEWEEVAAEKLKKDILKAVDALPRVAEGGFNEVEFQFSDFSEEEDCYVAQLPSIDYSYRNIKVSSVCIDLLSYKNSDANEL